MTTVATAIQSVLIDAKQPSILDHLGYDGAPVLRTTLAAGSLNVIAHDAQLLAIERVPADSVPMAIRRGVLTDRAAALRQITIWSYLVIVGELVSDRKGKAVIGGQSTGWDWRSIQGALASIQELGVIVLSCATDAQFGDLVVTLARRERGPMRVAPLREALFALPEELLLQAIPGIGEEKAAKLLEQCGTAGHALVALTDAGWAPAGVGTKTIEAARSTLGLQPNERLCLDLIEQPEPTK